MQCYHFTIMVLFCLSGIMCQVVIVTESENWSISQSINKIFGNDDKHLARYIKVNREDEGRAVESVCEALASGVSLLVDMTWTGWPSLQNLSSASGVPLVYLESPLKTIVRAIDDLIRQVRNALDVVIILEDNTKINELMYYMSECSPLRVYVMKRIDLHYVHNLNNMRPAPSFFVILGSSKFIESTYNTATELNYITVINLNRWLFFVTDFNFGRLIKSKQTLMGLYSAESFCCDLLEQVVNCVCPTYVDIINYTEHYSMSHAFRLMLNTHKHLDSPNTNPVTFKCSSQRLVESFEESNNEFYSLMEQSVSSHKLLELTKSDFATIRVGMVFYLNASDDGAIFGNWKTDQGFTLNKSTVLVPVKRFFRVGVAVAVPWSYHSHSSTSSQKQAGTENWEGYCIDFLDRLALELYFDYELVPSTDFGHRKKDGSWNGLVGDLVSGRTDLVVAPLTMTSEREEVIDFVIPYYEQSGISIVIRKPERQSSLFKFMTVLRLEVWLSIVGALVVTALMIWLLDKYSPYSAQNNKTVEPQSSRRFTLKESFWFAMTSFTPQGGGETPKALSGRTLVAAYWLFVVLMLATFTANLAAFLTVERMQAPVQSLEQLSRQSRINYTVVKNSDTHNYFRNMKHAEDILYKMWKEITLNASSYEPQYRVWDYPIKEQYGHILQAIEKAGPVTDAETGFRLVDEHESGWFALIHDASEIRYEISRNCNFTEVGEPFAEKPYALAVQQGSLLNEELSRKILDLQKERYFESLNAKYWNNSARSECIHSDDNEGITLESLGGVFIATLFGLALALITLAVEILVHKRKQLAQETDPEVTIYHEYISRREFCTEHVKPNKSRLLLSENNSQALFARNQLY